MDGDAIDPCRGGPGRRRHHETMKDRLPGEQLPDGLDDPRLSRATFTSDEFAQLRGPGSGALDSIHLTADQQERNALSSIQREQIDQLSPHLEERRGWAELHTGQWSSPRYPRLRLIVRDVDVLFPETGQHAINCRTMGSLILNALPLDPLDIPLYFTGNAGLLRLDQSKLLLPRDVRVRPRPCCRTHRPRFLLDNERRMQVLRGR